MDKYVKLITVYIQSIQKLKNSSDADTHPQGRIQGGGGPGGQDPPPPPLLGDPQTP